VTHPGGRSKPEIGVITPCTPEQKTAAMHVAAHNSADADELRMFLSMLDLEAS